MDSIRIVSYSRGLFCELSLVGKDFFDGSAGSS